MIVEMAGRPAEHLTAAIEKHIGVLNDIKDVEVHSIKVSEPRVIEQEGDDAPLDSLGHQTGQEIFTTFSEADFECESFGRMTEIMFDFMPSSVEVIEPGKLEIDAPEATAFLNNISGRLHRYDEIAKVLGERHKDMEDRLRKYIGVMKERDEEIAKLKRGSVKKTVKKGIEKDQKKVVKKKSKK